MPSFALAVLSLVASARAHGGSCAHDETERTRGGVDDSGYFFNRDVPYATAHGRRVSSGSFQPIRIHLDYSAGALTALSTSQQDYLRNTLMPEAVAWLQ